jgi:hypothetical protein
VVEAHPEGASRGASGLVEAQRLVMCARARGSAVRILADQGRGESEALQVVQPKWPCAIGCRKQRVRFAPRLPSE